MNQNDLVRAVNEKKDGDVQLTIVRDGNRQTISVTPEASKRRKCHFSRSEVTTLTNAESKSSSIVKGELNARLFYWSLLFA